MLFACILSTDIHRVTTIITTGHGQHLVDGRESIVAKRVASNSSQPEPASSLAVPPIADKKTDNERKERRLNAFIKTLPDDASAISELNWVRLHPAMLRRAQKTSNIGQVEITLADLKSPPHGPAPSKNAVQLLRHHMQNPNEFFKKDLQNQHDRASKEEGEQDKEKLDFLDDLTQVRKMIREATERHRLKESKKSQPKAEAIS
jgi:hypothetical protein